MAGPCFVVNYLVSSFFFNHLAGKEVNLSLYLNCLLMSFDSLTVCALCLFLTVLWVGA